MDSPSSIRNLIGAKSSSTHSVPIQHMDYKYIGECKDVKQLEKILLALRTGEEGFYPDLIMFCERRIEALDSKSKVLRKDKPPASMIDVGKEEWKQINSDLKDWTSEMNETKCSSSGNIYDDEKLPPIRKPASLNTQGQQVKSEDECWAKPSPDRIKSSDYQGWDKFDVDAATEDADKEIGAKNARKPRATSAGLASVINTEGMSDAERELVANKEKDKGNEAFKARDFDEAAQYYTRSISVIPSAPSYNNRSLARIKLGQFTGAVEDCTKVLKLEPENVKALLRRGTARKSLKEFASAMEDFKAVVKAEPNNKQAKDILAGIASKVEKKKQKKEKKEKEVKDLGKDAPSSKPTSGGRRIVIQEVEGDSESEEETAVNGTSAGDADGKGQTSLVNGTGSPNSDDSTRVGELNPVGEGKSVSNEVACPKSSVDDAGQSQNGSANVPVPNPPPASPSPELPANVVALKDSGNKLFKAGQYGEAVEKYSEAIVKILPEKELFPSALATLYSNRAACQSKTGHLKDAISDCDAALSVQPYNVKVLLRRGSAYETLERFRHAYVDYQSVLKLDGFNQSAQSGSNRMIKILSELDGPRWREKLPASPSMIGLTLPPPSLTTMAPSNASVPSVTSTTDTSAKPSMATSVKPITAKDKTQPEVKDQEVKVDAEKGQKAKGTPASSKLKDGTEGQQEMQGSKVKSSTEPQEGPEKVKTGSEVKGASEPTATIDPKLNKEVKFQNLKAEGNAFVQKGNYAKAMVYYTECIAVDTDQAVSYTNRALCFLKLNKGNEAEADCTRALELQDGNIKALYRRALARKMLQKFSDSARDLSSLLKIEPNNVSAKKELEQVKEKWRQELKISQQKAAEKAKENAQPQPAKSTGVKPMEVKPSEVKIVEGKPTEVKPTEVKPTEVKPTEVKPTEVKPTDAKPTEVKPTEVKPTEVKPTEVKPTEVKTSVKTSATKTGKKKGKRMQIQETEGSSDDESNAKETVKKPTEKVTVKERKGNKTRRDTGNHKGGKTPVMENDKVTVPKLAKVTAYEFLQAWTSLKRSKNTQAYADLLKQILPEELPEVLTNKLDGDMLVHIVKAVCEHLVESDGDLSYGLLNNLPKVDRFKTVALFLSPSDRKRLLHSLKKLKSRKSEAYTATDLDKLKQHYSL